MTDSTPILLDTNIILDVTERDERWAAWSRDQMIRHVGRMIINPIIYTELCYEATSTSEVDTLLITLGIGFEEPPRSSLFLAAKAFKAYRKRGGTKTSTLPDFFIGSHAAAIGIPILTRDVNRYRTYFPTVEIICP